MHFYPQQLFHIYNQGNNRQTIFFTDENYEYFLWKMRAYLLPFGDLITYCLMPTHYHWQFYVRQTAIERRLLWASIDRTELQRRRQKHGPAAKLLEPPVRPARADSMVTLNESIGIMQKAYARAINKEKGWTGSLFRKECKAKDGWIDEFVTLLKLDGSLDYRFTAGTDYAFNCFNYIHDNPPEAGLVTSSTDWDYSSAKDYAGLRKGSLCNIELGRRLLGLK